MNNLINMNPVLAETPAPRCGKAYKFQKTTDIIQYFETLGYSLGSQKWSRVNKKDGLPNLDRLGYQRHVLRFDHPDLNIDGKQRVQIVVRNSHDGYGSLWIGLGIYRLVCSNGLMAGKTFFSESIRHSGNDFYDRVRHMLEQAQISAQSLKAQVEQMKGKVLSDQEINKMVSRAISLKLPEVDASLIDLNSFRARRNEDQGNDLWTVLNRVQEVIVRGGIRYKTEIKDDQGNVLKFRNNSTRQIKDLQAEIDLNQAIYDQAQELLAA